MPQTDHSDLLERLFILLTKAAQPLPADLAAGQGGLVAPMPELNAAPRGFSEVFGQSGKLFPQLAAEADANGDSGFAALLRALEQQLNTDLKPPKEATPARRLLDYVYPVV